MATVYSLAPSVRSPETGVQSLFPPVRKRSKPAKEGKSEGEADGLGVPADPPSPPTPQRSLGPQDKWIGATLNGKAAALTAAAREVERREGPHIQDRVALTEGAAALQDRVDERFPGFTRVLDFIHANEYLWDAANALLGESAPERNAWVESRSLQLLSGQTTPVITELRTLAHSSPTPGRKQALLVTAAYFERNQDSMQDDRYLACGWPIATGVVEGACRHFVKDRCELSGRQWTQPGAEALVGVRRQRDARLRATLRSR